MQDLQQEKNDNANVENSLQDRRAQARAYLEGSNIIPSKKEVKKKTSFGKVTEEVDPVPTREPQVQIKTKPQVFPKNEVSNDINIETRDRIQKMRSAAYEKKRREDLRKKEQELFFKKIRAGAKHISPIANDNTKINEPPYGKIYRNTEAPSIIKTYKNDITSTVKQDKSSISEISNKEKDRSRKELADSPQKSKKGGSNKFKIIFIFIFILGIFGVAFFYNLKSGEFFKSQKEDTAVIPINRKNLHPAIITPDIEKNIDINDIRLAVKALESETIIDIEPNTIKNIHFKKTVEITVGGRKEDVEKPANVSDLLSMWTQYAPDILTRSLDDEFMTGIYTMNNGRGVPFLAIKTNAREQALAGMLEWENTLYDDFYDLFGLQNIAVLNIKDTNIFVDGTINKIDVRILKDDNKNTLLIYAFINENTIIITTDEKAITEALKRQK